MTGKTPRKGSEEQWRESRPKAGQAGQPWQLAVSFFLVPSPFALLSEAGGQRTDYVLILGKAETDSLHMDLAPWDSVTGQAWAFSRCVGVGRGGCHDRNHVEWGGILGMQGTGVALWH